MKRLAIVPTILLALSVMAQQAPVNSPLLDHLSGKWLLQGTVGKQPTTHDFDAEWVIQHHYLRFREVSRERNDKGEPQYEATVFIGWNEKTKQYACVWLDVYGGLTTESIGRATPKENQLAFVFTDEHGETSFTNTFIYNPQDQHLGKPARQCSQGRSQAIRAIQADQAMNSRGECKRSDANNL